MAVQPQESELVSVVSIGDILYCMFPNGIKLHGCVQNTVEIQVQEDQIFHIKRPSPVISDIISGLQEVHRQVRLIKSGKVEPRLLELHVLSSDLLDRALAPIMCAINANRPLRATYQKSRSLPVAALA
jgi:hypothetical protein